MFRSIRARIIAATTGCLVVALLLNTIINFQVTRQDNQQSQRDILTSTSASHNMAIADWVNSKITVITSAQSVALSDDPVPVFKQLALAGGFTNVYVGYASKTAKFSDPTGVPADYDPTLRPWYQQAVSADGPVVTAPYVDAGTGKLVVTFAVPGDVAMDSVVANVRGIHPTPASSGLLLDSNGTVIAGSDPALVEVAANATRTVILAVALGYLAMTMSMYFQAVEKVGVATFTGLLRYVICSVPLMYLLGNMMGVEGVWIALVVADAITGIISIALAAHESKRLATL